jgi:uncharacterized membrane protein
MLPPLPPWAGLHPVVVHFPIALLLAAPVLVVLSLIVRRHRAGLGVASLVLMLAGTTGAFLAVATGEAADELAERVPGAHATLEQHEELAETVRVVFSALTIGFAGILAVPLVRRREWPPRLYAALVSGFLLLYAGGAVVLTNAAHLGGQLVHRYGVHAVMEPEEEAPHEARPAARDHKDQRSR